MFSFQSHMMGSSHNLFPPIFGDFKLRKAVIGSGAMLLGIVLSVLLGPAVAVVAFVLVTKPSGELSGDSNTIYWVLASAALAVSLMAGTTLLTWLLRLVFRLYTLAMAREALDEYEEDIEAVLDECEAELIGRGQERHWRLCDYEEDIIAK